MTKFKSPHVHSDKWHTLSNMVIVAMFDDAFVDVAVQPSLHIVDEMRNIGTATLELLEDRTCTSVYRIRQTGVVYEVNCFSGETCDFDDYDDYQTIEKADTLVSSYSDGKLPNYTVVRVDSSTLFITRNNPPIFNCTYINGELQSISSEEKLNAYKLAKLMRGVSDAIIRFLRDEKPKE